MGRKTKRIPGLLLHKGTGQGRVILNGKTHYLGEYGSRACEERYNKLVGEWLATGHSQDPAPKADRPNLLVVELVERYLAGHVNSGYYSHPDGTETREASLIRDTLAELTKAYASTPVGEFGPLALKSVRELMVSRGLARGNINARIRRVRRMFKWGVANELVHPDIHQALVTVEGLRKGRSAAKETKPIQPVPEEHINAVLPRLPRPLRAMVQLMVFTGARPGEMCSIRPCDVNRDGDVWEYVPTEHKMDHADRERMIPIDPRGQAVLAPFLDDRPGDAYCFSPVEAVAERNAEKRANRKSKVQPSQVDRSKPNPQVNPGACYDVAAFRKALHRACKSANVPSFAPNRLRHTAATAIRRDYGLEGSQVVLGHSTANVTQVYAARDMDLARRIASERG